MKMREMIMKGNGSPPGNNKYSEFWIGWIRYEKSLQMSIPNQEQLQISLPHCPVSALSSLSYLLPRRQPHHILILRECFLSVWRESPYHMLQTLSGESGNIVAHPLDLITLFPTKGQEERVNRASSSYHDLPDTHHLPASLLFWWMTMMNLHWM
jgi:hypothetical protein